MRKHGSVWLGRPMSVALAAALMVAVHTGAVSAADDEVDVTMIIHTAPGDPFWNPVIQGATEAAEDKGVNLDIQYADNDPVKMNNLIETAIANQVDGIAVVNWIPDAFVKNIALAREKGIGLVVFDTDDPRPNATASQAYYVQSLYDAGKRIGTYMIGTAGLKSGDHVVCPVEDPDAFYGVERYRGIKEVLDAAGVTSERLDGTPTMATALTRIAEYLVGHPETDAVIGLGSVVTEVGPKAVEEAGMTIPTAGFDLSPGIVDNILAGKMVATIDSGAFYEGYMPIVNLYYFTKFGVPPVSVNVGGSVIDKSNVGPVKEWAGKYR